MSGDFIVGDRQYWLAEIDQHGSPKLTDGPHGARSGVEKALYLIENLGLIRGRRFACADVTLSPVIAVAHDANKNAISLLNSIGLAPAVSPDQRED